MKISVNPPKGTADWYPEEFALRNYIFDTWRKVCNSFAYDEYLWPLVEDVAIWEAKSGEDVGWSELTKITNRDGEISDLALRPEMTPTVTRMVCKYRREYPKPIRWFSIANFYRNERPQRGRNREFRQLNVDLFWEESIHADIEIVQLAIELMLAFEATREMFEFRINNRKVIDYFLDTVVGLSADQKREAVRTMDKRDKLSEEDFVKVLSEKWVENNQAQQIISFLKSTTLDEIIDIIGEENEGIKELQEIMKYMDKMWYGSFIVFSWALMRWFDYYDGLIFEMFDLHPDNRRALFGWGRYNGLSEIFWAKTPIPAVWFAPGDETMKLFLESHNLLPEKKGQTGTYIPLLDENDLLSNMEKAQELRRNWEKVEVWLKLQKENKAFDYAKKKGIPSEKILK